MASEDEYNIPSDFRSADAILPTEAILDDSYKMTRKVSIAKQNVDKSGHRQSMKPTNYWETLTHMLKGNIGCGILATGSAFKQGGLIFSPLLVLFLGVIACYNQYLLVSMANIFQEKFNLSTITFGETVAFAFEQGSGIFKKSAGFIRCSIKMFIILTQLGFCCVYFLFISQSLHQVLICYSIHINIHLLMLMVLPVIWITAMIRELKYIAPLSTLANVSIFTAFGLILYRACNITDSIYDRRWIGDWDQLPLCFGVVIYSLEGIGLVLPLQQNMKHKDRFLGPCGVLNLSLSFVTLLIATFGFLGYFKYGDNVKESLTLNLEAGNSLLTQVVICSLVLGILCTYALQFFIPVILIVPDCQEWFGKHFSAKSHTLEYILRSVLVLCTFLTAELIPHLDLFVSLVGAVGGTFLALIFTPLADIANRKNRKDGFMKWRLIFAAISLAVGFFGFFVGTIMSLKEIIVAIKRDFNLA